MRNVVVFFILFAASLQASASFRQGYHSPQGLIVAINEKFKGYQPLNSPCIKLTDNDRGAWGDNSPETGEPISDVPTATFLLSWKTCVALYLNVLLTSEADLPESDRNLVVNELIPELYAPILADIDRIAQSKNISRLQALKTSSFLDLKPQAANQLVAHLVEYVLGSDEEILSFGVMSKPDVFRADLLKKFGQAYVNAPSAAYWVLEVLFQRDEFLKTY